MPEFLPKGERTSVKEYKAPRAAPDFTKTPPEGGSGEPSTKEIIQVAADYLAAKGDATFRELVDTVPPSTKETVDVNVGKKSKAQQDEEDLQALFASLENSSTEELPR